MQKDRRQVKLAHASVKDFLLSTVPSSTESIKCSFSRMSASKNISKLFFLYLTSISPIIEEEYQNADVPEEEEKGFWDKEVDNKYPLLPFIRSEMVAMFYDVDVEEANQELIGQFFLQRRAACVFIVPDSNGRVDTFIHGTHVSLLREFLAQRHEQNVPLHGITLLVCALYGLRKTLTALLHYNIPADVNAIYTKSIDPVLYSFILGGMSDNKIVEILLEGGADPNLPNILVENHTSYPAPEAKFGILVQNFANAERNAEFNLNQIELLIHGDADFDAISCCRGALRTLYNFPTDEGDDEAFEVLLSRHNASPELVEVFYNCPLKLAVQDEELDLIKLLVEYGAKVDTEHGLETLASVLSFHDGPEAFAVIDLIHGKGVKIYQVLENLLPGSIGHQRLMTFFADLALQKGDRSAINYILMVVERETAIIIALGWQRSSLVEYLIETDVSNAAVVGDPWIQNLERAERALQRGSMAAAESLLSGVDPKSAVAFACSQRATVLMLYFLSSGSDSDWIGTEKQRLFAVETLSKFENNKSSLHGSNLPWEQRHILRVKFWKVFELAAKAGVDIRHLETSDYQHIKEKLIDEVTYEFSDFTAVVKKLESAQKAGVDPAELINLAIMTRRKWALDRKKIDDLTHWFGVKLGKSAVHALDEVRRTKASLPLRERRPKRFGLPCPGDNTLVEKQNKPSNAGITSSATSNTDSIDPSYISSLSICSGLPGTSPQTHQASQESHKRSRLADSNEGNETILQELLEMLGTWDPSTIVGVFPDSGFRSFHEDSFSQNHTSNRDLVEHLLKQGANVNSLRNSETPLSKAIYLETDDCREVMQLLLEYGANVELARSVLPKTDSRNNLLCVLGADIALKENNRTAAMEILSETEQDDAIKIARKWHKFGLAEVLLGYAGTTIPFTADFVIAQSPSLSIAMLQREKEDNQDFFETAENHNLRESLEFTLAPAVWSDSVEMDLLQGLEERAQISPSRTDLHSRATPYQLAFKHPNKIPTLSPEYDFGRWDWEQTPCRTLCSEEITDPQVPRSSVNAETDDERRCLPDSSIHRAKLVEAGVDDSRRPFALFDFIGNYRKTRS
ncbi:hypothetical protein HDK64DRAFT_296789 [Phyllosticta capitalensis]